MDAKLISEHIFRSAVKAADPYEAVRRACEDIINEKSGADRFEPLLIGFGKASCRMAAAVADAFGDSLKEGVLVTKYGHSGAGLPGSIRVIEAGHPVPDENGQYGAEEILRLVRAGDPGASILCLVSGGGSALFAAPCKGLSLKDKQEITRLLLLAGADITDLNIVRKHLSRVKGGRLAEVAYPRRIVSLILSDVPGDRLDIIASGPTVADPSTYGEALSVLRKYGVIGQCPQAVLKFLEDGAGGREPETPKPMAACLERADNIIVSGNSAAVEGGLIAATVLGLRVKRLPLPVVGEAREAGRQLARIAREEYGRMKAGESLCLVSGGETTVTVRGSGKGGRNMELALSFAMELGLQKGISLLSAGTDGTDGPTDAAGALVDAETMREAGRRGIDPQAYLDNNDSYSFFDSVGGLLRTGPTGTNVMDMQVIVIKA